MCELEDLGFSGVPFTYDNGQYGNNNVRVRLDRVCADEHWRDLSPTSRVVHLASSCSDHCPVVLEMVPMDIDRKRRGASRYEIMWERDPSLPGVIANSWAKHRPHGNLGSVAHSLKDLMRNLKEWSNKTFGHVLRDIENLRTQLADLQQGATDRALVKEKMNELDELLYREEMLWLQRSRITWLKEGERNTEYLHRRAVWRARRNYIQHLRKLDGTWCISSSEMELMMRSYF